MCVRIPPKNGEQKKIPRTFGVGLELKLKCRAPHFPVTYPLATACGRWGLVTRTQAQYLMTTSSLYDGYSLG